MFRDEDLTQFAEYISRPSSEPEKLFRRTLYPWISIFLSFCPIRLQKKIILQLSSSLLLSSKNSPSFVVFALHLILREGSRKSGGQTGSQLRSPPKIFLMSRTLGPWGCMKWVTQLGKTFETKLTLAVDSKRQRRFTLLKSRKVQLFQIVYDCYQNAPTCCSCGHPMTKHMQKTQCV